MVALIFLLLGIRLPSRSDRPHLDRSDSARFTNHRFSDGEQSRRVRHSKNVLKTKILSFSHFTASPHSVGIIARSG